VPMTETTTVEDLSARLAAALTSVQVGGVRVAGEIADVRYWNGHAFFDLRGREASLACVVWRPRAPAGTPPPLPKGPVTVRVLRASWETRRGCCRLSVVDVVAAGHVAVASARALLREQLIAEGALPRAPRALPDVPRHICVITGSGSAAEADLLHGLQERWPCGRATFLLVQVQGRDALRQVPLALARARHLEPAPDVIVCSRGGGSAAELADVFDHETVVRACLTTCAPLICAIGHESDRLLAEEAADFRAKTPSSAIEMAVPSEVEVRELLQRACRDLEHAGAHSLARAREALRARRQSQRSTTQLLNSRALRANDALTGALARRAEAALARARPATDARAAALRAARRGLGAKAQQRNAREIEAVQLAGLALKEWLQKEHAETERRLVSLQKAVEAVLRGLSLASLRALLAARSAECVRTARAQMREKQQSICRTATQSICRETLGISCSGAALATGMAAAQQAMTSTCDARAQRLFERAAHSPHTGPALRAYDAGGKRILRASDLAEGDELFLHFQDGAVHASVRNVRPRLV